MGERFRFTQDGRCWIVFPMLAIFKRKPRIRLDREHTEHIWIHPQEMKKFKTLPKLEKSYQNAKESA